MLVLILVFLVDVVVKLIQQEHLVNYVQWVSSLMVMVHVKNVVLMNFLHLLDHVNVINVVLELNQMMLLLIVFYVNLVSILQMRILVVLNVQLEHSLLHLVHMNV